MNTHYFLLNDISHIMLATHFVALVLVCSISTFYTIQ